MSNVRTFLLEQGLIEAHDLPSQTGEFRVVCPKCQNIKTKCYVNAVGKGTHCFHCGYSSSWRGFQRLYEPPTPEEAAVERFVATCQKALSLHSKVVEYLEGRRLNTRSIETFRLGYCPLDFNGPFTDADRAVGIANEYGEARYRGRLIIPYLQDGYVVQVRGRLLDPEITGSDALAAGPKPKYLGPPNAKVLPFHTGQIDPKEPVILCEGEIDAILLHQELEMQAVGIPGASVRDPEVFGGFSQVYIAFDADDAGRKGADAITKILPEARRIDLPDGFDISDYLINFGKDSFSQLYHNATLYVEGKPQKEDRFESVLEAWTAWAFSNGELLGPKIGWAPRMEKAISGWSRGLFLLGAMPQAGKSCWMVKSALECARDNPDAVAVYLSLDDDIEDCITRFVSLHSGLSFELIRNPRFSLDNPADPSRRNPEQLAKFFASLEDLKQFKNLIVRDATYGRSLAYIRRLFRSLRKRFPDNKIVVFIDYFSKITGDADTDTANKSTWKAFLAAELKYLSTENDLCIVTPTDLRKLNEDRRPTNDDLKDAVELHFESNVVMLGYNEVSMKGIERSFLKWKDPNLNNLDFPIVEWDFSKNKKTSFRGIIRYYFHPLTSDYVELNEEDDRELSRKLREMEEQKKEQKWDRHRAIPA